ncbi:MAG: hypothetical protein KBD83_00775 [Gammaproteobacteria bacterium]|nr:hypothetical protein [Gammaproteobacteria bacterium]
MMNYSLQKRLVCGILLLLLPLSLIFASDTQRILFVCGGNTGRSPMAESLANEFFDFSTYGYEAFSRGVNVNPNEIMPEKNAVIVMHQWDNASNIDMHRAQSITISDIDSASIVLTMTAAQKERLLALDPHAANKIFMLSQCANGTLQDVSDMYGHDLAFYQETGKQIAHYLQLIKDHGFFCQTN